MKIILTIKTNYKLNIFKKFEMISWGFLEKFLVKKIFDVK